LLTLPLVAVAASLPPVSANDEFIEYSRELYEQLLASGEPFMLDFYASW
jgi:thiol:disulfide interchange protein